jgi:hypothetical protein
MQIQRAGFFLLLLLNACVAGGETISLRLVGDWTSDKGSVAPLLQSVAGELIPLFPEHGLPVIEVEQKGGPITLFKRGPNGEIRVKLASEGTLWAQYSFQFAHELGHIVCRYDDDNHSNKWFEESVCEMASLFVLRRMAVSWEKSAPFPNWAGYRASLKSYADDRLKKSALPAGQNLAAWYAERAESFRKNATQRESNLVVAAALLPYFEEKPERWRAFWFLNVEKMTPAHGVEEYFAAWRKHCPEELKPVVAEVAQRLGVALRD